LRNEKVEFKNNQMGALLKALTKFDEKVLHVTNGIKKRKTKT
jgi:hypothetical protein